MPFANQCDKATNHVNTMHLIYKHNINVIIMFDMIYLRL